MFQNYFKTAWRNLWKNKVYASINIAGLAIGMAACLVILVFVSYERSFDNFHKKNIYRLNEVQKFEGMVAPQKVALSMYPMGPTLKEEFPEIKNYTRINAHNNTPLYYREKKIYIKRICFVDSTFLDLFDFNLLKGDRHTVLEKKNNIVLTQAAAEMYFGKEDPIGKTLVNYDRDTTNLVVAGVLENVPQNSQIQFDALVPFSTVARADWMENWGNNWLNTYLELASNTNIAALEKKFPAYIKKHMTGDYWKYYELFLLPLKEVHAGATDIGLDSFNYQQFDKGYTNIFFIIAVVVLMIACINFMNLSTARSAERAREVGVRKSIGAFRWQLALQFISESVMLSFIALLFAIGLVIIFLPLYQPFKPASTCIPGTYQLETCIVPNHRHFPIGDNIGPVPGRLFVLVPTSNSFKRFLTNREEQRNVEKHPGGKSIFMCHLPHYCNRVCRKTA